MRCRRPALEPLARRRCTFRVHIDHLDNPDGDVWAVHQNRQYRTVHQVLIIDVPTVTVFAGPSAPQPRAFVTGRGLVRILTIRGQRFARIARD